MRITVEATAFTDPRFKLLSKRLRCSRDSALVRMQMVWLLCTTQGVDRFPPELLAVTLRCKSEDVAEALCGSFLGELLSDGQIRIRGCTGRTDWLEPLRQSAKLGGTERAKSADRDTKGRFLNNQRDLAVEIRAVLSRGPLKRRQLRQYLRCRNDTLQLTLRAMLDSGEVRELERGALCLAEAAAGTQGTNSAGTHGIGSAVPPRNPAGPSALTPALALAPVGAARAPASAGLPAHDSAGTRESSSPATVESSSAAPSSTGTAESIGPRDLAPLNRIAVLYDDEGRKLDPQWRSSVWGGPKKIAAVWRPEDEGKISEADVVHAVRMLAAEADERRARGSKDPCKWYRKAFSENVFRDALAVPNEEAARQRAREAVRVERRTGEPTREPFLEELDRRRAAGELL